MAIVKTGREGKASGRNVLQEEWKRTWSEGRSMGLTVSQLPLSARILREDRHRIFHFADVDKSTERSSNGLKFNRQ